ncbi:uncharacterized protein BDW43DRAFT_279266 [Aspergillus alliaceus]|uniref:uncharacterized protein n=1 Tax=Petromyces alliaceus TaxID=209559 RepID=UPI0012A6EE9B|nr:uncharacterized protein BDW43DRAFT_279266 [Aspergillus alliaceus]KAB8232385.1 hypothetical protein BDW43DRAFT_279266 [Aspergillus alliaceus]
MELAELVLRVHLLDTPLLVSAQESELARISPNITSIQTLAYYHINVEVETNHQRPMDPPMNISTMRKLSWREPYLKRPEHHATSSSPWISSTVVFAFLGGMFLTILLKQSLHSHRPASHGDIQTLAQEG